MYKNIKIINKTEADKYFLRNKKKVLSKNFDYQNYVTDSFETLKIKPKNILEIGCFNGYKLNYYRNFFKKNNIKVNLHGIDLSNLAIKDGKKKYPHLNLKKLSSLNIDKLKIKFDLIICDFLYLLDREYIFEQFDKIYKNLNKKGLLLISDFDPLFPHYNKNKHNKNLTSFKVNYTNFITSSYLFKLLYKCNWKIKNDNSKFLDKNYSILIFEKIDFKNNFPKNV